MAFKAPVMRWSRVSGLARIASSDIDTFAYLHNFEFAFFSKDEHFSDQCQCLRFRSAEQRTSLGRQRQGRFSYLHECLRGNGYSVLVVGKAGHVDHQNSPGI